MRGNHRAQRLIHVAVILGLLLTTFAGNLKFESARLSPLAASAAELADLSCAPGEHQAQYFSNMDLSGTPAVVRCEPAINHDWGQGSPVAGIGADFFSVRWTGAFDFATDVYTFAATTDDGIRIKVDGTVVLESWKNQGATTYTAQAAIDAGVHTVVVEYYEYNSNAVAKASWWRAVPSGGTCSDSEFLAEYFNNRTLDGAPVATRCEPTIFYNFGTSAPVGVPVGTDSFSIRWTQQREFPAGDYVFRTRTDDGVRLRLDGALIIDQWRNQGPTTNTATRSLSAGAHTVVVEYYEATSGAVAEFSVYPFAPNEEFDATTLDPKWFWVREDPSHWSLTSNPGHLRMVTQPKDLWQSNNTAPLLLQAAPAGDFDITTRVALTPTQNYQQGGLIMYANDDNYVRLQYGYVGGRRFEFGKEVNGSWQSLLVDAPAGDDFYLRIRRSGSTFTGYFSQNGSAWVQLGQYANMNLAVSQVGLFVLHGQGVNAPEIPVDFDFFHAQNVSSEPGPTPTPTPGTGSADGITYAYDDLGRLTAVIDPASEAAVYHYDAAGNVLSIDRQSAAQVSIIQVTPASAPVGATVTLYGTGFSATAGDNAVAFNGVAATVTRATTTQLTVTVPPGASSGPISVTTPAGSATSTVPFTIRGGGSPTISGFSPLMGSPGSLVTISGTNFAETPADNVVAFNGIRGVSGSSTSTDLAVQVPPSATSGKVSVTTAFGTGVSNGDFIVPPPPFAAGDVEAADRMAIGGTKSIGITQPNKIALMLFDGTQGQRISLNITGNFWYYTSIINPDGSKLVNAVLSGGDQYLDRMTLPATGTYTILLDGYQARVGTATLRLYDVPPDATGTIAPDGSPVSVATTVPGQNALITFEGTQGQQISLKVTNSTMYRNYVSIKKPDGSGLVSPIYMAGSTFIDTKTLPVDGTYTILIDPDGASTGSLTLRLYDVPPDASGAMTIGGPSVTMTATTPGQNIQVTFDGTQGQQVNLNLTNSSLGYYHASIRNPDGTSLVPRVLRLGNYSTGTKTLPATGTYTIIIDPDAANTGSITLPLSEVASLQNVPVVTPTNEGEGVATADDLPPDPTPESKSDGIMDALPGERAASPATGAAGDHQRPEQNRPSCVESEAQPDTTDAGEPADETWTPEDWNLNGDWHSHRSETPCRHLAALQADPGVTAITGQVLLLNGKPLKDATLRIEDQEVRTDANGQFLLADLAAGHHVLVIDGSTAGKPATGNDNGQGNDQGKGKRYGIFEVGVDLAAGETTVLPYTIWMPRLDLGHMVRFASPTADEVVLTNPRIPGLEVHIPKGSTVTTQDGAPVTELGITPIPVDRPPFPLPFGVHVPVYFTVQPAGTSVLPDGAWIVYPNYTHAAPGTRVDFWHYDPVTEGWYIYGQGTVTPDGKQIVPDPGVRIYEFTGAMIDSTGNPPATAPTPGAQAADGDPVDLSTGLFVLNKTDLVLPGTLPITLTRTYRPGDPEPRAFGVGSTFMYDMFLWSTNNYRETDLILPDGSKIHYPRVSAGTSWTDAVYEHTATPTMWYKSRITWNGNGWDLTLRDGTVYEMGDWAPIQAIRDRYGNRISISRSYINSVGSPEGNITQITSSDGRWVRLTYDSQNRIVRADDNAGRTVRYTYDASGHLATVTDPSGGVTSYTYDAAGRMTAITDAKGITFLTNEYDANGRVIQQTQADGTTYQFSYTLDANGKVTQTDVTGPRGTVRRVTFNASGYPTSDTAALGTPEEQTVTYERQAGSQLVLSVTDALGRTTAYGYDATGNVTSITRLAGTAEATTTSLTYEGRFNQVTGITDPLGRTTAFGYDARGNLTEVVDALGHRTTLAYDTAGRPTSVTDPAGHTIQLTYAYGDLVTVTDPAGHTSKRFVDGGGRPITVSDPLGSVTRYTYDPLNQLTQITDALGGTTTFGYDANGNLTSVTDPRGSLTSYAYDVMDRTVTRTDPLGRAEHFGYDANGNLTQATDRKGQVTSVTYDALNRPVGASYADGSSTTASFDAGNRLTELVDSSAGTLAFGYDDLDRLTSETTPQGTVSYTYDAAGRRTGMTVAGQTGVSYSYDDADRLTQISQGGTTVGFGYDAADRRTSLTLPNGITVSYAYDAASRLSGMTYALNGTALGDLTYGYDAAGRRTSLGGSFARTGLPAPLASASYDAANQLTTWNGTSLSYDANGNLTSDGATSYTWDARNRLTGISGPVPASFAYDALGRRTSKTTNGVTTGYLYDGVNLVQELTGGSPSASLLTGLGVDEVFARSDTSGTMSFLTDALGSTLALADASGTLQTEYTYDPFGATTVTGAPSANGIQYTGRENDGTGLYYYRARYYSPTLQRFLSQDPLGFAGGDLNLYGYVLNGPTNYTDPSGQFIDTALDLAFIGYDIYALVTGGRKDLAMNSLALGLDVAGMLLPGVTGLGAASRAAKVGAHAADLRNLTTVYRAVDEAGEVIYAGITNNIERRAAEHLVDKGLRISEIDGLAGLSRTDARAVEQALIEFHGLGKNGGTLVNKINSIARSNPAYADLLRRGSELLRQAGYPGF